MKKIISLNNKTIKDVIKLKKYDENYFLIEGLNLINEALKFGIIKSIITTTKYIDNFKNFKDVILINEKVLNKITSLKNPNEPIAVCEKKNNTIKDAKKILLIDNIADPGNLGTIVRSAASFGFTKIISSEKTVSFYNPKTLRSTQGAFLHSDLVEKVNLEEYIKILKNDNYYIIGTFLNKDSNFKKDKIKDKKIALILGSEGNGINLNYYKYIDSNYKLNTNKIESLNVAIAASVIMYTLL